MDFDFHFLFYWIMTVIGCILYYVVGGLIIGAIFSIPVPKAIIILMLGTLFGNFLIVIVGAILE